MKDIINTKFIAVYCSDNPNIRIYNYEKGTRIDSFHISSDIPKQFFSLPEKNLLAIRTASSIIFYDYTTYQLKYTFERGANNLNSALYFQKRTDEYNYFVLTVG